MLPGRPFAANWSASRSAPSPDPPAASTSAPRSPHRNAPSWPSYSSPTRPGSTSSPRRPQPSDQRKHPRLDTRRSCVPSRVPAGQPHNSRTIPRTQLRNPGNNLELFLRLKFACLGRRSNRLGALGAVVEQPPHLVGHAACAGANALADAYRGHRAGLPRRSAVTAPYESGANLVLRPADAPDQCVAGAALRGHGRLVAGRGGRSRVQAWPETAETVL